MLIFCGSNVWVFLCSGMSESESLFIATEVNSAAHAAWLFVPLLTETSCVGIISHSSMIPKGSLFCVRDYLASSMIPEGVASTEENTAAR